MYEVNFYFKFSVFSAIILQVKPIISLQIVIKGIERRYNIRYTQKTFNVKWTRTLAVYIQGGHRTGKTGNLVLTFSRQGKHREFCFDTGKNFEMQGKYLTMIIKIKSMFIF